MAPLSLVRVTDSASPVFDAVRAIYDEAFPPSERKPAPFLHDAVRRSDYLVFAAERDDAVVGLGIVYRSGSGFSLLEYIAVAAAARGLGLGSALFAAIAAQVPLPMLLEVESERRGVEGDGVRRRRLEFYRRLSCRAVADFAYVMPQVAASRPPPMDLLVLTGDAAAPDADTLRGWLDDIYRHVYGRGGDDPDLARMRDSIGPEVRLA